MLAQENSHLMSFTRRNARQLTRSVSEEWNWQSRGRCLGYPSEAFFPEEEQRQYRRQREEAAKRICRDCPVIANCRDHALKTPELYGIWGAMTARERARAMSPRRPPRDGAFTA